MSKFKSFTNWKLFPLVENFSISSFSSLPPLVVFESKTLGPLDNASIELSSATCDRGVKGKKTVQNCRLALINVRMYPVVVQ